MSWKRNRQHDVAKLFTFTSDQWNALESTFRSIRDRGGVQTMSAFVREILMNGYVITVNVPADARETMKQIRAIGRNINQVAFIANASRSVDEHDIRMILDEQKRIETIVKAFQSQITIDARTVAGEWLSSK
ncbi:plasmid mobilization relaxosome protein MobC [Bifidobacterium biavatii]|uniref:Mobilization protein n=1 Tax=Bifidobacterium biavatii DSM 23969 TaxID=1437608 RepID=A0A086ZHW5_9BIFI|nr:plasmid mobilization relaxosome protein MobC [Bifidobacterium biavatii]KFI46115.1 mobilization protein [Bifidobacterium biavatii DSM 23969]